MACACLRMGRALPRCPWPPLGWRSNCRRWMCLTPRWFCSTPRPCPPPWHSRALACADVVLVVLDAAWRAVHLHASLQALLAGLQPHQRVGMVVTGVDPRSPSRRDALAQLRLQWPGQLLPYVLHQDEHLPRPRRRACCVHQMAPLRPSRPRLARHCQLAGAGLGPAAAGAAPRRCLMGHSTPLAWLRQVLGVPRPPRGGSGCGGPWYCPQSSAPRGGRCWPGWAADLLQY